MPALVEEPIGYLVDRAISADGHDQLEPIGDCLACEDRRVASLTGKAVVEGA
jgi:hypothetical protein